MPGPFIVRKAKSLTAAEGAVTGDGPGTENAVSVQGMNQVVLLLDANDTISTPSTRPLDIYMETSINGTDYYRETDLSSVTDGTVTVKKRTYQVLAADISGDDRLAIAVDVLSAFARFTFSLGSGTDDYGNVACRALTGRV